MRIPIRTTDESQRNAARVAGFTFLFGMAIVVPANYGISFRLSVPGNAAETAAPSRETHPGRSTERVDRLLVLGLGLRGTGLGRLRLHQLLRESVA